MCGYLVLMPWHAAETHAGDIREYHLRNGAWYEIVTDAAPVENTGDKDSIAARIREVEIFVNGRFVEQTAIDFVQNAGGRLIPCLTPGLLIHAGVLPNAIRESETLPRKTCLTIDDAITGSSATLSTDGTGLNLNIPHNLMRSIPRGWVDPADYDPGITIGFVNYQANQYHAKDRTGKKPEENASYVSLTGGVNYGLWRFRQQANWSRSNIDGSDWNVVRSYVQRALPELNSELTMGESSTSGSLFPGFGYRGVQLASDDRMLPDSMLGYAPVIHGIARTNARVEIHQNGNKIYETSVAPGAFEINDVVPPSGNGDLDVAVIEADGTASRFNLPYPATPMSLRPGISRYSAVIGTATNVGDDDPFGEFTFQRGLNNAVTGYGGLRLAEGYSGLMLGGVHAGWLGAVGVDATYSHAELPDENPAGWMVRTSYGRTFQPTRTSVSILGYRYSTEGFRNLSDVFGLREAHRKGTDWRSSTYGQRTRLEASINQSLADYGSLYLSGSTQEYHDRGRDTRYQFGYSTKLRNIVNLTMSLARQRTAPYYSVANKYYAAKDETTFLVTLSFPFDTRYGNNASSFSSSVNHTRGTGSIYQSAFAGALDKEGSLNYGLNLDYDQAKSQKAVSANVQKRFQSAQAGLSASGSKTYTQAAANISGSIAVHGGGVTMGQPLSDTFALVEAKEARGSRLSDSKGIAIDENGYALLPSLKPYRYNSIALEKNEANATPGIRQRVVPYAGAAVKLNLTPYGKEILIRAKLPDGRPIPPETQVFNERNEPVAKVSDTGEIRLRCDTTRGLLTLRWGEDRQQSCSLRYRLKHSQLKEDVIVLKRICS